MAELNPPPIHSEQPFARNRIAYQPDVHCGFGLFRVFFQQIIPSFGKIHIPKVPVLHSKSASFAFQKCQFCDAKWCVLQFKMVRFAMQNGAICNAKWCDLQIQNSANCKSKKVHLQAKMVHFTSQNSTFITMEWGFLFDGMGHFER